MIKEIINVLSQASKSYEDLLKNIDLARLQAVIDTKKKFRFMIEGIGKKVSSAT